MDRKTKLQLTSLNKVQTRAKYKLLKTLGTKIRNIPTERHWR